MMEIFILVYILYSNYFACDMKKILQYPTQGQHHIFDIRLDSRKTPIPLASHPDADSINPEIAHFKYCLSMQVIICDLH